MNKLVALNLRLWKTLHVVVVLLAVYTIDVVVLLVEQYLESAANACQVL